MRFATRDARHSIVWRKRPASAGIERSAVRIARPKRAIRFRNSNFMRKIAARAKAGIDDALCLQRSERRRIILHVLGLTPHWLFPIETQPMQRVLNGGDMLWPAALGVDILDAQQETPMMLERKFCIQNRRQRMAAMQRAVRARRKAKDGRARRAIGKRQFHGAQT